MRIPPDPAAPILPLDTARPAPGLRLPLGDIRLQYLLTYAVMGAVLPYAPVFFRAAGFDAAQVGYVYATSSVALIVSPVLLTLLADTRADPRRLIALMMLFSGASLVALGLVSGFWPIFAIWAIYCLTSLPLMPLQDGVCFSQQRRKIEQGQPALPYHRVRVWGTIGYIVPSLLLFGLLQWGMPVAGAVMSGAAFAALGVLQAFLLEDPRPKRSAPIVKTALPSDTPSGGATEEATIIKRQLPTFDAFRALLFRPVVAAFVAAVLLTQVSGAVLGAYYPIYLTERVGIDVKWVGLIAAIGVMVEICVVFAGGWITARLGIKRLLLIGIVCSFVRMALLAASDSIWIAIGTQAFHGIQLLAIWIMPQAFVDRCAADRYRNSMQGVYVMLLAMGRGTGLVAAGLVARPYGIPGVFVYAAGLCAVAAVIAAMGFREPAETA